jgi:hypothetical protein
MSRTNIAGFLLVFSLCLSPSNLAAQVRPAPQTARQALLEMFFSKTPGTFEQHLPEATRAAMHKGSADTSMLGSLSLLTSQMHAQGQDFQTFDTGSTLLIFEDHRQNTKFEISVESDDLQADRDDIVLGFHASKNGETQTSGVTPALTLTMKPESGTWRLTDLAVTVQLSLTNPEFLKAISTPRAGASGPSFHSVSSASPTITPTSGLTAPTSMHILLAAEKSYAKRYPSVGYTCSLADLGGMGAGGEPGEHQAMLINPRLASGKKDGYAFTLAECKGKPAATFKLTAAPTEENRGMPAYCSDETLVIRSDRDGSSGACFNSGVPVP